MKTTVTIFYIFLATVVTLSVGCNRTRTANDSYEKELQKLLAEQDAVRQEVLNDTPKKTLTKDQAREELARSYSDPLLLDITNPDMQYDTLLQTHATWINTRNKIANHKTFWFGYPPSNDRFGISVLLKNLEEKMNLSTAEGITYLAKHNKDLPVTKEASRDQLFHSGRDRHLADAAYDESRACIEYFSNIQHMYKNFIDLYKITISSTATREQKTLARWRLDALVPFLHISLKAFLQKQEGLWAPEMQFFDAFLSDDENEEDNPNYLVKLTLGEVASTEHTCVGTIDNPEARWRWIEKLFAVLHTEQQLHRLVFGIHGKEISEAKKKKLEEWAQTKENDDNKRSFAIAALFMTAFFVVPWFAMPVLTKFFPTLALLFMPTGFYWVPYILATFYVYHVSYEFVDHKVNPNIERSEFYQWEGLNLYSDDIKRNKKVQELLTIIRAMEGSPQAPEAAIIAGVQAYRELKKASLDSPILYAKLLVPIYQTTLDVQAEKAVKRKISRDILDNEFGSIQQALDIYNKKINRLEDVIRKHPLYKLPAKAIE